jgi:hypothetical protein
MKEEKKQTKMDSGKKMVEEAATIMNIDSQEESPQ